MSNKGEKHKLQYWVKLYVKREISVLKKILILISHFKNNY